MISVKKALSIIKSDARKSSSTETVKLECALGRITADNIYAKTNNPPFNMSAMDGYAVSNKSKNNMYELVDEVFAGQPSEKKLLKNQAIRVFTGSKLPHGTKTVLLQENIKKINQKFIFNKSKKFTVGQYIRVKGLDFRLNTKIISKQKEINSRDLALLFSANVKRIKVYKKPTVVLIASGDELIISDKNRNKGSVYASSLFMLDALIGISGATCVSKEIIKDKKYLIMSALKKASLSDIIITTGGVSVGKKDLIRSSLKDLGFREKFWKIDMKPGKPMLYGMLNNKPVFSLPGNPVSSYVCFLIFILPYIYKKLNINKKLIIKTAYLENKVFPSNERNSYSRGVYHIAKNRFYVKTVSNQDSSLLNTLSEANCLVYVPKGNNSIAIGKEIEILILPELH